VQHWQHRNIDAGNGGSIPPRLDFLKRVWNREAGLAVRAIFINYRRSDAEGESGRLFSDLANHFGESSIFMDVVALDIGRDFRKEIDKSVESCGVLLAIIGKDWVDARNERGARRLDDPNDYVRLEIASALKRDIPVIPVLVRGAKMPLDDQLPDNLKELAYRNGVELTHARWSYDLQVLIKGLEAALGAPEVVPPPNPPRREENEQRRNDANERKVSWWKSRRGVFALLLAAGVVAAALAYPVLGPIFRPHPAAVEVPSLGGSSLSAAEETLRAVHLQTGNISRRTSPDGAKNIVLEQFPTPGMKVYVGSSVDLVVSGDPEVTKPGETPAGTASVSISQATCAVVSPGAYHIDMNGSIVVPSGQTYLLYAEADGPGGGSRWRPICQQWSPAQASDGTLWEVSCVHQPNDPTQTAWQAATDITTQNGQPPTAVYAGTLSNGKKAGGAERTLSCEAMKRKGS